MSKLENIEWDGINHADAPDYCDAFITYAEDNGEPLTDKELDELNDNQERVYELLIEHLY